MSEDQAIFLAGHTDEGSLKYIEVFLNYETLFHALTRALYYKLLKVDRRRVVFQASMGQILLRGVWYH